VTQAKREPQGKIAGMRSVKSCMRWAKSRGLSDVGRGEKERRNKKENGSKENSHTEERRRSPQEWSGRSPETNPEYVHRAKRKLGKKASLNGVRQMKPATGDRSFRPSLRKPEVKG